MRPPQGLEVPTGSVLLLQRPLYGLKQSGREWYIEACRGLKTLGFQPLYSDPSVFTSLEQPIIIGLYVDDMVVLGPELQAVQRVVQGIQALWEIKDLGDIQHVLGLTVLRDRARRSLEISQRQYIEAAIQRFQLGDAVPVVLPATDRNTLISGTSDEPIGTP